ncbi:MAG TPA: hypothetical protein VEH04_15185 [Verrucomicrobiae bacterium]|nr:hypothetical protein [Verrucomicrobiae bacterium]
MEYRLLKPALTRSRMLAALVIAMAADAFQIATGAWGWFFLDQFTDVIAMILVSATIGFHILFLPTFVAEFIPAVGMLPTWTGCVLLVLARRWKEQQYVQPQAESSPSSAPPPVPPGRGDIIDV